VSAAGMSGAMRVCIGAARNGYSWNHSVAILCGTDDTFRSRGRVVSRRLPACPQVGVGLGIHACRHCRFGNAEHAAHLICYLK
jgi:hypothetical protein